MAIVIDKKIYRNIQEQVEKNKRDIAAWTNIQFTLNNFGITVLGRVAAEADIPEGTYSYGDAYLVGETEPYDIYIYTRDEEDGEFIDMGPLSIVGPTGAKGDQGDAGTIEVGSVSAGEPGTNPIVTNSGTAQNAVLNFVIPKGDKGDTGAQGNAGPKGDTGERGPIGLTGPQGDPGQSFMIIATITNTSQLPDPTQTPRNYAYVYKDGDQLTPDLIYFITGEVGSEVWSYASFAQTGTTVSVNGNPVSAFNADTKQNVLTFDNTPTANSNNPVKSGGIYDALDSKQPTISGNNKLSSDLVTDTNHTNKFVTASQITSWTNKLDKATGATTFDEVYTKLAGGTNSRIAATEDTYGNSIVKRDSNARFKAAAPSDNYDVANKKYVDDKTTVAAIRDLVYPVGSIYMSVNSTSPATLFGGTWVQLKDRFLLGAGDTYANGATGGEASHTLTINEMPSHDHNFRFLKQNLGAAGVMPDGQTIQKGYGGNVTEPNATNIYELDAQGGGQAHNNMPPYLVVYMWKRTS